MILPDMNIDISSTIKRANSPFSSMFTIFSPFPSATCTQSDHQKSNQSLSSWTDQSEFPASCELVTLPSTLLSELHVYQKLIVFLNSFPNRGPWLSQNQDWYSVRAHLGWMDAHVTNSDISTASGMIIYSHMFTGVREKSVRHVAWI